MDIADRDILIRDIKVYLAAVMTVANAPILPFDWRATAAEFAATLEKYRKAAATDAHLLEPVATALRDLSSELTSFYTGIAVGTVSEARANAAIQSLARILIPLNYTRGPRFTHDPALPVPGLPAHRGAPRFLFLKKTDGFGLGLMWLVCLFSQWTSNHDVSGNP